MKKTLKENKHAKFRFIFILTVFAIMTGTALFVGILAWLLFVSPLFGIRNLPPHTRSILYAIACIIVGTILSAIFGRIIISPLDELIDALNSVIDGDYTVKVTPRGIRRSQKLGLRFNHMTEELQSISTLNEDFVNNFSHEFKTPITSIHGFAKLLRDEDIPQEKRDEYLDIIVNESERLARLSQNALLFTKIEDWNAVGNYDSVNLTEQIRETVVLLENKWAAKDISFGLDGEDYVAEGNKELLSHIWLNIIDNAVKFSPVGGEITINVSSDGEYVTSVFCDNGEGMDEEEMEHLFEKFYQGDKSHFTVGNGLGMPLVKKITELHGGTVTAKSAPGEGAQITVKLPIKHN